MSVQIPSSQTTTLTPQHRNAIYTALLSGPGIASIEQSLSHNLQRTGWLDALKSYITTLLRSGECTTIDEVMVRVKAKLGLDLGEDGEGEGEGKANGEGGGSVVNGNGTAAGEDVDLKIPDAVVREGSRTVRRELERVVEISDLADE